MCLCLLCFALSLNVYVAYAIDVLWLCVFVMLGDGVCCLLRVRCVVSALFCVCDFF